MKHCFNWQLQAKRGEELQDFLDTPTATNATNTNTKTVLRITPHISDAPQCCEALAGHATERKARSRRRQKDAARRARQTKVSCSAGCCFGRAARNAGCTALLPLLLLLDS
jgi:hypothetical protein